MIEKKLRRINAHAAWLSVFTKLAVVAVAVCLIFTFVFGVVIPQDPSMNPAVKEGDLVLYYRWQDEYIAGDVVVYEAKDGLHVGRVVAGFTDTVEITESGELLINSYVQSNEYGLHTMPAVDGITYPLTIGVDNYFILGDNRESSQDSREFGVITRDDVKGKVFTILRRRNI